MNATGPFIFRTAIFIAVLNRIFLERVMLKCPAGVARNEGICF